MNHTPAQISEASQQAAAFLAHYASGDGLGMAAVQRELGFMTPQVERFLFAMGSMVNGYVGDKRRADFVDAMRYVAQVRAGDETRGGGASDL